MKNKIMNKIKILIFQKKLPLKMIKMIFLIKFMKKNKKKTKKGKNVKNNLS